MENHIQIAYFTNEYPKVSHSFIRREILSLEKKGYSVQRISLRGWDNILVDQEDRSELLKTKFVLKEGPLPILRATLKFLLFSPAKFLNAFKLACKIGIHSVRPLPYHLIYLAEACLVADWVEESKALHLHAHFGNNSAEVALLVNILGGPNYSFTVHGQDEVSFGGILEKVNYSNFIVAVSSFGRGLLYNQLPYYLWSKVKVVRCGVDEHYNATNSLTKRDYDLVCVGRFCKEKGQHLLLRSVASLKERGSNVKLVLAGDGEMRAELEQQIRALDIESNVTITGWLDSEEVKNIILKSRCLVLPSFSEGLPVVIIEALSLGRPVISTFVGGIPELVTPKINGWLVPSGSIDKLTDAIESMLLKSESELEEMGKQGQVSAATLHSTQLETDILASQIRASIKSSTNIE